MTLKTSLLITGDSALAQKAADDLKVRVEALGAAGKGAAGGVAAVGAAADAGAVASTKAVRAAAQLEAAQARAAAAADSLSRAHAKVAAAAGDDAEAQARAASAVIAANARVASSAAALERAQAASRKALGQDTEATGNASAAKAILQHSIRSTADSFSAGLPIQMIVGEQMGRLAEAAEQAGGKLGAAGAVLGGPWGLALQAGLAILIPFVGKLFEGGDGAETLKGKSLSLEDALQKQAIGTNAARKAIEDYNRAQSNAVAQDSLATDKAIGLAEARLKEAGATIAASRARLAGIAASDQEAIRNPQFGTRGDVAGLSGGQSAAQFAVAGALHQQEEAAKGVETALAGLYTTRAKDNAKAATDQSYALNRAYDRERDSAIRAAEGSLTRSKALDGELTSIERRRKAALDAQKDTGGGSAGGDAGAAAKLASATNEVERAQARLTITRRDANAELKAGTITQAEATARITASENALNAAQAAARAHAGAVRDTAKASREAEAESRKLDTAAEAIRVRFEEADGAAGRYKKTLEDIAKLTAAGKFTPVEGALFSVKATLEEQKRTNPDAFKTSFDKPAVDADIKAINDHAAAEQDAAMAARHAANDFKGAADTVAGAVSQAFGSKAGSIISGVGSLADRLIGSREASAKSAQLQDALRDIAKKVGISPEAASTIGKYAGKGLEGAASGALANSVFAPIAKGLGLGTSQTGAQLGGGLGGALGAIPTIAKALGPTLGAALGPVLGIAGSLLGGLLKASKNGGATLGADGSISTSGNSASRQASAAGAAGSIVDGVKQIAQALGGTVGKLSPVTIGTYGKQDEYRVNTTGGTTLGGSKSGIAGVQYFGSGDAGAADALAYAIQLEVQRGAVEGLSAAVQKAIKSSPDINAALQEAGKVQDVELIAKGLSGQFEKAFKDLETTAKERVRIATEYGLDVVAIEKRNAEDRVALVDQLTKQQAGALQSLVTDLTSGDLFEGSYKDKIDAIGGRIDKAKADMEAGVSGAADTLADLYRQQLAAEKDAYGETAQYAAARNSTIADAQAAIAKVNAQINAAKSDPALATTNAALDENNSQNAELITAMATQSATLKQIAERLGVGSSSSGDTYFDLSQLAST